MNPSSKTGSAENVSMPFLTTLDHIRQSYIGQTKRDIRSDIGQFLTPAAIARFMASLFEANQRDRVRILDAGAGTGVLFAACVEALVAEKRRPRTIEVVAYENDERVLPELAKTMTHCHAVCRDSGIAFRGETRTVDFIEAAIDQTEPGLFAHLGERFTHAILNPPYKKINSQSSIRKRLDTAGMEISNLYAAFVWLAARLLEPGGELTAITPRSFCNGPYFRRFRTDFLAMMSIRHIHVFESRKKAFGDDQVLQENVIYHAVQDKKKQNVITISSSEGINFENVEVRTISYNRIVLPKDRDAFIHLIINHHDDRVMKNIKHFAATLAELGLEVSTGRVVDFRAREHLRMHPEPDSVPLIYPSHFMDGFVRWPVSNGKKANAIKLSQETDALLVKKGYYVLTKRFSAKEERRRVVAAVYDPERIISPFIGFENHVNYFHAQGKSLPKTIAKGLALYLNSSLFDQHFRLFSGHTQVNATDLRKMTYPSREKLEEFAQHFEGQIPDQNRIDAIIEQEC